MDSPDPTGFPINPESYTDPGSETKPKSTKNFQSSSAASTPRNFIDAAEIIELI